MGFNMMKRALLVLLVPLTLLGGFAVATIVSRHAAAASNCVPASGTNTMHGTLDGANYIIAVPANWNGTLVLYSHGYTPAFVPLANPAPDAPSAQTGDALLQEGYALAGSSYSQNGWALQQAFHDDIALLDFFNMTCGHPTRTIPWGSSMGGMITAGLVQLDPSRFAGALPMCGLLSGSVGLFNLQLDGLFTFNLLLASGSLQVVNFTDPNTELAQAESILTAAQQTPQGRARIALFSSLEDVPGWFTPGSPDPAPTDYADQEQNQYLAAQVDLFFDIAAMAEAEGRAGGNYSWNTDVNYFRQFAISIDRREVEGLYGQAGLNLLQDLKTIQVAPRISADPSAVSYMKKYIVFNGDLDIPVLTMHTTGDPLVFVQTEQAYASVVREAGDAALLRQVFVERAGHCAFTDAEMLTAFHTLIHRVDTGHWGDSTDPALMNDEAAQLGASFNAFPPAFLQYDPAVFLRPFDAHDK